MSSGGGYGYGYGYGDNYTDYNNNTNEADSAYSSSYGQNQTQDTSANGTYAGSSNSTAYYPGSYDQSYINQSSGMNVSQLNMWHAQMQWQMMQHFYSTNAYGGGGGGGDGYGAGAGGSWNNSSGNSRGQRYGHDPHGESRSNKRQQRYDPRHTNPDPHHNHHHRPHITSPYLNMPSSSQQHRSPSPRSSSPHRSSPIPAPPPPSSPSPSYLQLSASTPTTLYTPSASRKLLILDLNGTLVLRSPRPQGKTTYNPAQRPAPRAVYPRPYMGVFREWMFHEKNREWLDVMVWSSAQPHSVEDMVMKAFGEDGKERLKAVWARDKMGLGADAYHQKVQTIKDLTKPWTELFSLPSTSTSSRSRSRSPHTTPPSSPPPSSQPAPSSSSPDQPTLHSAQTTLLLDDSFKKAILQPYNHVIIKEYTRGMRSRDLEMVERDARKAQIAASQEQRDQADREGKSPSPGQEEGEEKMKKQRRKEKKAKQLEARNEALDAMGEEIVYDETLLAIIGILDEAKMQANVAAWVRSGGLWGPHPSPGSSEKVKNGKGKESGDAAQAGNGEVVDDAEVGEESEAKEVGQPIWYDEKETMGYWVNKGREAAEELGIEVRHGVEW